MYIKIYFVRKMRVVYLAVIISFSCISHLAEGNCPEIPLLDIYEIVFCSKGQQSGSECFLKCNGEPDGADKSKLACECNDANYCDWAGDMPDCDRYICLVPDHEIAKFRLMDSWSDGFAGLIEFQDLPKNITDAWSIVLNFDRPLGPKAKLFASSMKVMDNSDDNQKFTLRNDRKGKKYSREIFDKKYPRSTILVTDFEGDAPPTSGYIGLYESIVDDGLCFEPIEFNEFVPVPSPMALDQILLVDAPASATTGSPPTTLVTSPTPQTTKFKTQAITRPTTRATTTRSTTTTAPPSSSVTRMENRFCKRLNYADAITIKKSWVEERKTFVNGHIALQHKALQDWLVVIVFPNNVLSIEVWNVAIKGGSPPNRIWKLAPFPYNKRMGAGLFDISFIAKFAVELDYDPEMEVYICDTSFTSAGGLGQAEPPTTPRTTRTAPTTTEGPGAGSGTTTPSGPSQSRPLPANRCSPSARTGSPVRGAGQTQPRHRWNKDKTINGYNKALHYSILFYEAQRSGMLPSNNRIPWRGDSTLKDGCQIGVDLTKGWFDAGDHVKFNFPMAWSVTTLAWGGLLFRDAYEDAREYDNLLDSIRWPLEYMLNCHTAKYELIGQVGNGRADHAEWGRPEQLNTARPLYKITADRPGSDLAGEFSAAFTASSLLFKGIDQEFSNKLLKHAKELYDFADKYRGRYNDSMSAATEFYPSTSGYKDELLWASAWLYKATNQPLYLTKAKTLYTQMKAKYYSSPVFSWDHKLIGAQVLLADLTKEAQFRDQVAGFMDNMMKMRKTPKGMIFYLEWGPARYAASAAFIGTASALLTPPLPKRKLYLSFAKKQIDYLLGAITGQSFVTGYGAKYPKNLHHRGSSCRPYPSPCDWNSAYHSRSTNHYILYGALAGGPSLQGRFQDRRQRVPESEPACDYNAGFQSAVAGLKHFEMK